MTIHPSTVSRELRRNSNSNGEYVWLNVQTKADARNPDPYGTLDKFYIDGQAAVWA